MNDTSHLQPSPHPSASRREQRTQETRRTIQETAVSLFAEHGYDDVTVEEVAAAVGVSHMTIFRHFPTKSALVFYGNYDEQMLELLRTRLVTSTVPAMVFQVYRDAIGAWLGSGDELTPAQMRIVHATPALQGAIWADTTTFQRTAVEVLVGRFGDAVDPFAMQVLMATITAASMMALLEWAAADGAVPIDVLLDRTAAVMRDIPR